MKKLIISLITLITCISCTTTQKVDFIGKRVYEKVIEIKDNNKILNLELKGKVNLQNKEINLYHIQNIKIDNNIPKIILDIDYNHGISDGLIVYNKLDGNFQVDFKSITNEVTTINKKIPFLIVPKNSNININLSKNIIVDNTKFIVETEEKENVKIFMLVPYYLNEETRYIKLNTPIEYHTNLAYYKDKYILEYNLINSSEKGKLKITYTELKKEGYVIKGTYLQGGEVVIENDNEIHRTKVDDNGNWLILLNSPKGIANIYGITKENIKSKINIIKWGE